VLGKLDGQLSREGEGEDRETTMYLLRYCTLYGDRRVRLAQLQLCARPSLLRERDIGAGKGRESWVNGGNGQGSGDGDGKGGISIYIPSRGIRRPVQRNGEMMAHPTSRSLCSQVYFCLRG